MKYCTFKYQIIYEDGSTSNGWSPYKGRDISTGSLAHFVNECFQLIKPAKSIVVTDIFKISDESLWRAHVQHSVEYQYLIAYKGFSGPDNSTQQSPNKQDIPSN